MKKTIITILLTLVAMVGQAQTIPTDWFKTDTITIRGRIEGYELRNHYVQENHHHHPARPRRNGGAGTNA